MPLKQLIMPQILPKLGCLDIFDVFSLKLANKAGITGQVYRCKMLIINNL